MRDILLYFMLISANTPMKVCLGSEGTRLVVHLAIIRDVFHFLHF